MPGATVLSPMRYGIIAMAAVNQANWIPRVMMKHLITSELKRFAYDATSRKFKIKFPKCYGNTV